MDKTKFYYEVCELFSSISEKVWDKIAKNNRRLNFLYEEEITRGTILNDILDYIEANNISYIYAQSVKNEKANGGDLELYYEFENDKYLRFFFQAKIIKEGKYFSGLLQTNSNGKQIDLIKEFEKIAGCQTYYIFYNGIEDFRFEHSDCFGIYNEKQLGCTIVDTSKVQGLVDDYGDKLKFKILYDKNDLKGNPWRKIPCCLMKDKAKTGFRIYSYNEINSDNSFLPLYFMNQQKATNLSFMQSPASPEIVKINRRLKSRGYNPTVRIVLSKTEPNRK